MRSPWSVVTPNPILGADEVKQVLGDYRDAVQFIHDKTVEGMNKGLTPDELVEYVQLPEDLASKDYLQPFYGHPEWGVRSVFNGYLGWFDGNPSNLFRLSPKAEAERVAKLAGGKDKLLESAHDALAADDNQWAAQLADHLLAINTDDKDAKQVKANALTNLASNMVNATARNYYLTVARDRDRWLWQRNRAWRNSPAIKTVSHNMYERLLDDHQRISADLASVLDDSVHFLSALGSRPAGCVPPGTIAETLPQAGMGATATLDLFRSKYADWMSGRRSTLLWACHWWRDTGEYRWRLAYDDL